MALLMFFAIGVVEMFIVAAWTKFVSNSQVVASGVVTFVNTIIYFYVLSALLTNVNNMPVIVAYALGCALGTMLATTPLFSRLVSGKKRARRTQSMRTRQPRVGRGEQFSPIIDEPVSSV